MSGTQTRATRSSLSNGTGTRFSACRQRDGKRIVAVSDAGKIRSWHAIKGQDVTPLYRSAPARGLTDGHQPRRQSGPTAQTSGPLDRKLAMTAVDKLKQRVLDMEQNG